MLALFLPTDGPARWIRIPRRTFLPEIDPARGLSGIREHLLLLDADRPMTTTAINAQVAALSRTDLRDQPLNRDAEIVCKRKYYGPVLLIGTSELFQPKVDTRVVPQLTDVPTEFSAGVHVSNSRDTAQLIGDPDVSRRNSTLAVRSTATRGKPGGEAEHVAFDEVSEIVSEYVELTQCELSNVQAGPLNGTSFFYTATVMHTQETTPVSSSTHGRITHHGNGR